ncbi:MAG: threonine--tRNA ligase [Patescibacteria group bacterium]
MENNELMTNKRHTLAHLLAAAVLELYPDTKNTIGPAVDNGFYYDFEFSSPLSENDLIKIETKMREILPTWGAFSHTEISATEAKTKYTDNSYKLELIEEIATKGETITLYTAGEPAEHQSGVSGAGFTDLCRGGHVENPSTDIDPAGFKLDRLAGAYWRGDSNNKMLTRIYGLAFDNQEELEDFIAKRDEAEKRDHRKLGKELDLFVFSEVVGKGLPLYTERGATIRRELERFIVDEEIRRGYLHVLTPDIARLDLYKKSGHYPHYKDSMYAPIVIDDEEFMLRPMTCPHHFELYLSKPHSYRELPMRIAEVAKLYRYEQSGELSGLIRVRSFCLADAHIICADEEQAVAEISGALDLIEYVTGTFGLKLNEHYSYRLSLGNRTDTEKYYKNDAAWDKGEALLRQMLEKRGTSFVEAENEAAFYGPKIDIQMKNVNGKEDTAFTVQYDFCMPDRFDLAYVDKDGSTKRAIVVHRSSIGALERIMAFLIEHYAGAFPTWLSPVQVAVLPVAEAHDEFAKNIFDQLKEAGLRVEFLESGDSLGKRIRNVKMSKTPYFIVIGDKEKDSGNITIENRAGDKEEISTEKFIEKIHTEIKNRS